MEIIKLEKKKNKYKVSIKNNDNIFDIYFYENLIIDEFLYLNKVFDEDYLDELIKKNKMYEGLNKAIKLALKNYTIDEIRYTLINTYNDYIEEIIEKIYNMNIINYENIAYSILFNNNKFNSKNNIIKLMENKNIDIKIINKVIKDYNLELYYSSLKSLINNYYKKSKDSFDYFKNKTFNILLKKGFEEEDIKIYLDKIEYDNNKEIKNLTNEYNKNNKLSKDKIVNKLLNKGYKEEDINNILK